MVACMCHSVRGPSKYMPAHSQSQLGYLLILFWMSDRGQRCASAWGRGMSETEL